MTTANSWTINIYRDRFIEFCFKDGERKDSKAKTSYILHNRRLSVAEKTEGTWQQPSKNVKKFILKGTWQMGNMT